MKKLLSLFAAFLFAAGMMAEPIVLPAVLDVTNVSFRSEGLPDFIIEEGQDYAGTYFDMGAHDSSNDTLLYAEWDVTIQPIKYNVAVDVYNTNSWRVQLDLLNQSDEVVKAIRYKGSSGEKGQFSIGSLDLSDLEAGDYKVRARAATAWSAMKLKDVIFEADYQGVSVALPGKLLPAYAELSAGASVANSAIAFAPATANNEYATWNVSFAKAGSYNVTIDMTASNGHTYGVALLSADGETQIGAVAEAQAWDTGVKELGAITVPEAGNYKVKLTNATQWSEAVLNSITIAAPAAPKYYLVGSMNDWTEADAYLFEENTASEGEYMLTVDLAVGDKFKVKSSEGTWYPDGIGNDFEVTAAYAGEKTIYFRPDGQGGEGWHEGVIYIAANEEPVVDSSIFEWTKGEGAKIEADNTDLNANNMGTMTIGKSVVARLLGTNTVDNNAKGYKLGNDDVCVEIEGTRAFAAGDTVVITGVCGGSGARAFAIAPVTAPNAKTDTVLTNTQENTSDILEYKAVLNDKQAGDKIRIFRLAGKTMYLYSIKVLPCAAPQPPVETKYFLKNNWDAAEEWTWKEMTKVEDDEELYYQLADVVFGGSGINLNTAETDIDSQWFPAEKITAFLKDAELTPANLEAKDTVVFIYTPDEEMLSALILGKFVDTTPQTEHTYTIAGSSAVLFGTAWDPTNEANNMTKQEDGTYKWEKAEVTLAAGDVTFKVCQDHDWAVAYPAEDYKLTIAEGGIYTVTITFDPANGNAVNAEAQKTGSAVVIPQIVLHGNFTGDWADTELFATAEDNASASLTLTLQEGSYEFGMKFDGAWKANGANLTRENASTSMAEGSGDMKIEADIAGEYVFTYTFETKMLEVEYPAKPEPILTDGYYLVGTFVGEDYWTVDALDDNFLLTRNEQAEVEEYTIILTLAEGDKFKAVKVESDAITTWYPDGENNDYVVDANHAGVKTIYFRPVANEDWGGHFYVEPNSEEALDKLNAAAKAVKTIENGMLIIRKGNRAFNILGVEVR